MKTKKFFVMAMASVFAMCGTQAMAAETQAQAETPVTVETTVEAGIEADSSYLIETDQYEVVKARATDIFSKTFYARESVVVYVSGDGDTDLDLFIYDASGNLIDSDTAYGDECICTFTPRWRGKFTIKVKNCGNVANCYRLRVIQ